MLLTLNLDLHNSFFCWNTTTFPLWELSLVRGHCGQQQSKSITLMVSQGKSSGLCAQVCTPKGHPQHRTVAATHEPFKMRCLCCCCGTQTLTKTIYWSESKLEIDLNEISFSSLPEMHIQHCHMAVVYPLSGIPGRLGHCWQEGGLFPVPYLQCVS